MAGILDGKVALVTGGASGIGRATAIAMAREGARVAVSDLSKEGLEATVALINAGGGQSIAIAGDVAEEADVANMVARTISAHSLGVPQISVIIRHIVDPGSVTYELVPLRMAKKLDPYSGTARMALEPWLVEAALSRLSQPLSPADQRIVVNATRTPHKVRWPEWWSEQP
jgi:NAD(P)-dependent dehydrogenase (short-subunit alcohol dehydrogenase family)